MCLPDYQIKGGYHNSESVCTTRTTSARVVQISFLSSPPPSPAARRHSSPPVTAITAITTGSGLTRDRQKMSGKTGCLPSSMRSPIKASKPPKAPRLASHLVESSGRKAPARTRPKKKVKGLGAFTVTLAENPPCASRWEEHENTVASTCLAYPDPDHFGPCDHLTRGGKLRKAPPPCESRAVPSFLFSLPHTDTPDHCLVPRCKAIDLIRGSSISTPGVTRTPAASHGLPSPKHGRRREEDFAACHGHEWRTC